MNKQDKNALFAMPFILLMGYSVAFAGSYGSESILPIPLIVLTTGMAFLIQWIAFIPAYIKQTEKYFDMVGGLTYVVVATSAFVLSSHYDLRKTIVFLMILVWASRLGFFLFRRINKVGKDRRFDLLKTSFIRFLAAWTLQGLWVVFTCAAAIATITTDSHANIDLFLIFGSITWITGFAIEVASDQQKRTFAADPANKGQFIRTGLWSKSRHPNYFGEIVLWIGISIIAFPVLQGWQYITLASPIFVATLLIKVSGIPLLEKRADEKWGGQKEYEIYKANTPELIPKIFD